MLYYLHLLAEHVSELRLLKYVTVRAVAGAGTAFLFCLLVGPFLIRRLQWLCSGEATRYKDYAPRLDALHGEGKKKTPTMGGLLIILAIVVSVLLWAVPTNPQMWLVLGTLIYMGAIGFADDYIKAVRRNPKGLSARKKLVLQCAWVAALLAALKTLPSTRPHVQQLMLPFLKTPVVQEMGLVLAVLFLALVIIGASNAVNLTDGLDGLAIGCTSSVALAYLVMAYVAGHAVFARYLNVPYIAGSEEVAVCCGCLVGASLGFLWFNCHPAQIFMGDTGSLALGGMLGVVAVLIKQELVLVVVGGVFVMEALSVILQVGWFKLKKRRIFACAPLHHHFELKPRNPWSETQVTIRFWILSIICALVGVLLLKIR